MPVETMTSSTLWPSLSESHGNPIPAEPNGSEWEMIADAEEVAADARDIVILPPAISAEAKGRPRSATVGGEAAVGASKESGSFRSAKSGSARRRPLRRCASTPDLLVGDGDHEVIVEDESDEDAEEAGSSDDGDWCEDSAEDETVEEDVVRVRKAGGGSEEDADGATEEGSEPVMVEEDASMDTSAWTLTSAASAPPTTTAWGSKNAPSFADILSKNADKTVSWGDDKKQTEAMLRDSHRRHHLRVRTKPKFIVSEEAGGGKGMMKHAHSTGDLTKMMEGVEQERQRSFGRGMKKQFSALMEEEDEGDFVIGSGGGGGGGSAGAAGPSSSDVMGETDAMDYYHRKEKGSQSTHNKKKERPDETKRKEISMYKKELQREKQQARGKGGGESNASEGGNKKKKNEKGFGGKKERRRL